LRVYRPHCLVPKCAGNNNDKDNIVKLCLFYNVVTNSNQFCIDEFERANHRNRHNCRDCIDIIVRNVIYDDIDSR
jgi:hypothetical protein